jgi:hypothetical protein
MAKSVLIAYASPASAEAESAFNEWYEGTHIPQVQQAVPAVSAATRYRVVDPAGASPVRYMCIYELDTDDVPGAAGALGAALQNGVLDMTPAMDVTVNPPDMAWGQAV